jgi:hypothetical protein
MRVSSSLTFIDHAPRRTTSDGVNQDDTKGMPAASDTHPASILHIPLFILLPGVGVSRACRRRGADIGLWVCWICDRDRGHQR